MKVLSKEFKSCGFNFEQIKRNGDVAIYKKYHPNHSGTSYEVIKISRHNGYNLGGNYVSPSETYPSNSQWGTHAWTCMTIESACERYDNLLNVKPVNSVVKLSVKRKPSNTKQLYLTCIITECQRPTTIKYLENKAQKLGTTVDELRANYISKSAMTLLNKGMSVEDAREALGIKSASKISCKKLNKAMQLNGRNRATVK